MKNTVLNTINELNSLDKNDNTLVKDVAVNPNTNTTETALDITKDSSINLDNKTLDSTSSQNISEDGIEVEENITNYLYETSLTKDNLSIIDVNEENIDFNFTIGLPDILFILTLNNKNDSIVYKENVTPIIAKIVILREIQDINVSELSKILKFMGIDKLNIFSIHPFGKLDKVEVFKVTEPTQINFISMGAEDFISHLNNPAFNFMEYNKESLYILKGGCYKDIKIIINKIEGYEVNIGRGGSQKAHLVSPLDLRLSVYLMAMFNFNYKYIAYLNTFNDIPKNRYLPFVEKPNKYKTVVNNNKLDSKRISSHSIFSKNSSSRGLGDGKQFHTSSILRVNDEIQTNKGSIFSYLDEIENIIKSSDSLFSAQKKIETSWISLMKEKLEDPNVSSWRMLPQLIKKSVLTLEKHEKKGILKRRFKLFTTEISSNKNEIVLLTLAMLISNYSRTGATNISIQIGSNIAFLLFKQNINFDSSGEFNLQVKFAEWKKDKDLDSNTKLLKLGDYFINLFTNEPTQIFEFGLDEEDLIDTSSERIIKISPEYLDIIKETLMVHPTSLPMICEPLEWSDNSFGGFIENKLTQDPINTGSSYHGHRIDNRESLYKAVNFLNKTEFNVNKELLDYILNEGNYLLSESQENEKKNFQDSITLKVASIYSKFKFYLNLNSDWRGRLYTNSFFLTYQGGDLSRSLIEFAKGEKLTENGLKYLCIYAANCYNSALGKKSITQRVNWVKKNKSKIISMDKEFINKASKKIQFTAVCLALKNYETDNNYLVKLPVFLDATCSGIQHLAAMLQDINLGTQVNLLSRTEDENVKDLYQTVVKPINKAINECGKNDNLYPQLVNVALTRDILKTPIMTQVYNVTADGIYRQLIKKFKKEKIIHPTEKTKKGEARFTTFYNVPSKVEGKEVLLSYTDVYKMADIIKNESFNVYPSLKEIYNYFIDSAKLMIKLNIPIVWFTPAGLEIRQHYYLSEIDKVKLTYFGKTRTAVIREWKGLIDKNKQTQSIIPNIIHSLDASHLINVINFGYSKGVMPIVSIHDCFGTLPNNMDILANIVKSEFALLYTEENFLQKYHERVINSIKDNNLEIEMKDKVSYVAFYESKRRKDGTKYISAKKKLLEIPNVPTMGSLDLKNIINATYLIN